MKRKPDRSRIAAIATATMIASAIACQSTPPAAEPESLPPDENFGASVGEMPEDANPGLGEPESEASVDGVSDAKVEAFARAYVAVVALEEKYNAQMQAAASPAEAESVQAQAQQEMQQVIEGQGITLVEFEQIGTKAGDDEGLRMRVEEKLMEVQQPEAAR
jgi:hypothetical protein